MTESKENLKKRIDTNKNQYIENNEVDNFAKDKKNGDIDLNNLGEYLNNLPLYNNDELKKALNNFFRSPERNKYDQTIKNKVTNNQPLDKTELSLMYLAMISEPNKHFTQQQLKFDSSKPVDQICDGALIGFIRTKYNFPTYTGKKVKIDLPNKTKKKTNNPIDKIQENKGGNIILPENIGEIKESEADFYCDRLITWAEQNFPNEIDKAKRQLQIRYKYKDKPVEQAYIKYETLLIAFNKYCEIVSKNHTKLITSPEIGYKDDEEFKRQMNQIEYFESEISKRYPGIDKILEIVKKFYEEVDQNKKKFFGEDKDGIKLKKAENDYKHFNEFIKNKYKEYDIKKTEEALKKTPNSGDEAVEYFLNYNKIAEFQNEINKKRSSYGDSIRKYTSYTKNLQSIHEKYNLEQYKDTLSKYNYDVQRLSHGIDFGKFQKYTNKIKYETSLQNGMKNISLLGNLLMDKTNIYFPFKEIRDDEIQKQIKQEETDKWRDDLKNNNPRIHWLLTSLSGLYNGIIDFTIGSASSLGVLILGLIGGKDETLAQMDHKEEFDNRFKINTSSSQTEEVYNSETWEFNFNLDNTTYTVASSISQMLGLIYGGGAIAKGASKAFQIGENVAGKIGLFSSSFITQIGGSYQEAVKGGLSGGEALGYSMLSATMQSGLELISPNEVLLGKGSGITKELIRNACKSGSKESFKMIGKIFTKNVWNEIREENIQEALQTVAGNLVNMTTNGAFGSELGADWSWKNFAATAVITTLTTGITTGTSTGRQMAQLNNSDKSKLIEYIKNNNGTYSDVMEMIDDGIAGTIKIPNVNIQQLQELKGLLTNQKAETTGKTDTGNIDENYIIQLPKEAEKFTEILGSRFHEERRQSRLQSDGTYAPRVEKTSDQTWISQRNGQTEVDIANTPFEDLPSDWKSENLEAAKVAVGLVYDMVKNGEKITSEMIEKMAKIVHNKRLERNGIEGSFENQRVPYEQLSEVEKEKDRNQLLRAIETVKQGNTDYFNGKPHKIFEGNTQNAKSNSNLSDRILKEINEENKKEKLQELKNNIEQQYKQSTGEELQLSDEQLLSILDAHEQDGKLGELTLGQLRVKVKILSEAITDPKVRRFLLEAGFCGTEVSNNIDGKENDTNIENLDSISKETLDLLKQEDISVELYNEYKEFLNKLLPEEYKYLINDYGIIDFIKLMNKKNTKDLEIDDRDSFSKAIQEIIKNNIQILKEYTNIENKDYDKLPMYLIFAENLENAFKTFQSCKIKINKLDELNDIKEIIIDFNTTYKDNIEALKEAGVDFTKIKNINELNYIKEIITKFKTKDNIEALKEAGVDFTKIKNISELNDIKEIITSHNTKDNIEALKEAGVDFTKIKNISELNDIKEIITSDRTKENIENIEILKETGIDCSKFGNLKNLGKVIVKGNGEKIKENIMILKELGIEDYPNLQNIIVEGNGEKIKENIMILKELGIEDYSNLQNVIVKGNGKKIKKNIIVLRELGINDKEYNNDIEYIIINAELNLEFKESNHKGYGKYVKEIIELKISEHIKSRLISDISILSFSEIDNYLQNFKEFCMDKGLYYDEFLKCFDGKTCNLKLLNFATKGFEVRGTKTDNDTGILNNSIKQLYPKLDIEFNGNEAKKIMEFIDNIGGINKGYSILVLTIEKMVRDGVNNKNFNSVLIEKLENYMKVFDMYPEDKIPDGLKISIGLEIEMTRMYAERYKNTTGNDYQKVVRDITGDSKTGKGKDGIHEFATKPSTNPMVTLLEIHLLQELNLLDINDMQKLSGNTEGFNYKSRNGTGYHLNIGSDADIGIDENIQFIQNFCTILPRSGISNGENVSELNHYSNIRSKTSEFSVFPNSNSKSYIELRTYSVDDVELFEKNVIFNTYAVMGSQAMKKVLKSNTPRKVIDLKDNEEINSAEDVLKYLEENELFLGERDLKSKKIAAEFMFIQIRVLRAIDDYNQNFIDSELFGEDLEKDLSKPWKDFMYDILLSDNKETIGFDDMGMSSMYVKRNTNLNESFNAQEYIHKSEPFTDEDTKEILNKTGNKIPEERIALVTKRLNKKLLWSKLCEGCPDTQELENKLKNKVSNIDRIKSYIRLTDQTAKIDRQYLYNYFERNLSLEKNNLYYPINTDFVNTIINLNNFFLKKDDTNANNVLQTTKYEGGEETDISKSSIFETGGYMRKGYNYYQGGSDNMLIHISQRIALDYMEQVKDILTEPEDKNQTLQETRAVETGENNDYFDGKSHQFEVTETQARSNSENMDNLVNEINEENQKEKLQELKNDIEQQYKQSTGEELQLSDEQLLSIIDAHEQDGIIGELTLGQLKVKVKILDETITDPKVRRFLLEAGFCGKGIFGRFFQKDNTDYTTNNISLQGNLNQEEYYNIMSRLPIEMQIDKLEPKYKINIGEDKPTLFVTNQLISNGRPFIIGYIFYGDKVHLRMFYKSNSEGNWRACIGMREDNNFSKGETIPYSSYETTTKIDYRIQKIFDSNIRPINRNFETNKDKDGNILKNNQKRPYSPIEYITNTFEKHFKTKDDKYYLLKNDINTSTNKVLFPELIWNDNKGNKHGFSGVDFYNKKFGHKIDDVIKGYNNLVPKGLDYEHMKINPNKKYVYYHQYLKHISVQVCTMKLHGKDVEFHFAKALNSPDKVWIENITYADQTLNSWGLPTEQINAGPLIAKPIDYADQCPITDKNNDDLIPYINETYRDIRNLYQGNPIIKKFKQISR